MSCLLADDNALSPFSEMILTCVHMNAVEATNPHLQNPKRKKRKKEDNKNKKAQILLDSIISII
jgi:hypothetical protein